MSSAPTLSRVTTAVSLPLLLVLGLATTACGEGEDCLVGSEKYRTELYFGLDRANAAPVSESEWQKFVDDEVTPLFHEGLTIFNANGQYRMSDGTLIHESSKVIILLHKGTTEELKNIETIRDRYKSQFSQDAVLRVDSTSCVAF